jgi:hypothetical protein
METNGIKKQLQGEDIRDSVREGGDPSCNLEVL